MSDEKNNEIKMSDKEKEHIEPNIVREEINDLEIPAIYEIGFCCFCQNPCNPMSQSCGTCSREL